MISSHSKGVAKQGLRGHETERNYSIGADSGEFSGQPPATGSLFRGVGTFVQARLSPLLEFEVLDGVGYVDFLTRQARFRQRPIEKLP